MAYIFLDESGDFSKKGDNQYFVVASFMVDNPKRTYNDFRVWTRSKMPRVMRNQSEVKFSNKDIDEVIRKKTLKMISSFGVKISYSYLLKSNIPDEFKYKGDLLDGDLYSHIVKKTIEGYFPIKERELRIFCDDRSLKGLTKLEFTEGLQKHFESLMPESSIVRVYMVISQDNPNIQIADWIVGALAWYHNGNPLGLECFKILKNCLMKEGKELFKDHWLKNKKPDTRTGSLLK